MTLSYQWYEWDAGPFEEDGEYVAVSGATDNEYDPDEMGKFFCRVMNAEGTIDFDPQVRYPAFGKRMGDNAGGGLICSFRVPGGMVKVIDPGTPANNYSNLGIRNFFTYNSPSAKLCRQESGKFRWASHNLALYSEDLTNWTNVNSSDSGTTLTASSGTNVHSITRVPSALAAGFPHTARVRLKAGTHSYAYLNVRGDASEDFVTILVNLATGAITETDVGTSSGTIIASGTTEPPDYDDDYGAGWWDVWVTFSLASVSAPVFCVGMAGAASDNTWDAAGTTSFNAAGTETVQIKRAQINRGYIALEYLTTTSAATYDLPLHYDAVNGWGLLNEIAQSNLALYSADQSNAAWTKTNMTAAYTATAPLDGDPANTATTLTATSGNATCTQAITSASGARYTYVWLRRRTGTGTVEITQDNGSNWTTCVLTSEWQRFAIPLATLANPTIGIRIVTSGDAVDCWNWQHVTSTLNTALTSPIPTLGATVTRAHDNITKSLSAMPSVATAGFCVVCAQDEAGTGGAGANLIDISDGTGNERLGVSKAASNIGYSVVDGGAAQASMTLITSSPATKFTVAFSWAANSFKGSGNAGAVTTDSAGTLPTTTTLTLGNRGLNPILPWVGLIYDLLILPRVPVNDVEMQTAQTEMAA